MDKVQDDRFMVYIRYDPNRSPETPEAGEQAVAACATYSEARQIRQALQTAGTGECVIRYVGPAGGGD